MKPRDMKHVPGNRTRSQKIEEAVLALYTAVEVLDYGTRSQISCLNQLCVIAEANGLGDELEEYALKATDLEIAEWVKEQMLKLIGGGA